MAAGRNPDREKLFTKMAGGVWLSFYYRGMERRCRGILCLVYAVRSGASLTSWDIIPASGLSAGRGIEYRITARPSCICISSMNLERRFRVSDALFAVCTSRSGLL